MVRVTVLLKKFFFFLCNILGITSLMNCMADDFRRTATVYGPPVHVDLSGSVHGRYKMWVSGIKVRLLDEQGKEIDSTTTIFNGDYDFFITFPKLPATYKVVFEDVDGAENGEYKTEEWSFTFTYEGQRIVQDIYLEEKNHVPGSPEDGDEVMPEGFETIVTEEPIQP